MNPEILELNARIMSLQEVKSELEKLIEQKRKIKERCNHEWGETIFDPIIEPPLKIEPIKQGSDYYSGCDIPERRIDRWVRTCKICGLKQETKTQRIKKMEPDFK
jgi:hypothetical protein